MNFKEELKDRVDHIEAILKEYLPNEEGWQKTVIAAMNYSVLAGGKRLRPMLMEETYRLFGAFETAIKSFTMEGDLEKKARALSVLAQKAGIYGMIGGQTADIEAEDLGDQVTTEHLMFIHAHKTSALIEAAMMTGAILAGASQEETAQIEKAAYEIGIAFQIQDDILDVTSTLEMLGKPIGSDAKNHKTTYVTLKGLEESRKEQQELSLHAIETIRNIGYSNDFLMELVTSLITREK